MGKHKIVKGNRKVDRMDSRVETYKHIQTVQKCLGKCIRDLLNRQEKHDQSKLIEPELSIFDEYTGKLKISTYGSDEYAENMRNMRVALDNHYSKNRHHPEFFAIRQGLSEPKEVKQYLEEGKAIEQMNLMDLLELIVDHQSACERHADGDIYKSIEMNQKRFGYSDQLKKILINTVDYINSLD